MKQGADAARNRSHVLDDILFFGVILVVTVCALPGMSMVELTCGFMLGFWQAFAVSCASLIIASCASFLLGRYFLKDMINQYLESRDMKTTRLFLRSLEERNGLVLLVLFRLMLVPLFVKNYGPSVIKTHFGHFAVAVTLTTPMYAAMLTYAGSRTKTIADLAAGGSTESTITWYEVVPLVASIIAGIVFTYLAYREFVKLSGIPQEETRPLFPDIENTDQTIGKSISA